MNRIKHIIKKEFIQIRRDRVMMRILFIMPIIQLLLLGYVVSSEVKRIQTVVCDLDNSQRSRQIIDRVRNSGYFNIRYFDTREHFLHHYLDSGKATVAIVIPADFSKNLRLNHPTKIQILVDGQDSNTSIVVLGYMNGILENFLSYYLALPTQSTMGGADVHLLSPVIRVWYNEELEFKNYMIPGLVVFILTMVTTLISAMGLVREREIGTLEQLLVTPIKKHELLIGKIVPFAIIGLVNLAIAIIFARLWYHIPIAGNLGLFGLFAIIYLFTTLGIGLFVSASAHTQQQAMFMTFFFIMFFLLMSGFFFQIDNMPRLAQYLTYLDPLRYLMVVVREIFIKGSSLKYLYGQGIALVIFGGVIFSFAVLRFQKRMK